MPRYESRWIDIKPSRITAKAARIPARPVDRDRVVGIAAWADDLICVRGPVKQAEVLQAGPRASKPAEQCVFGERAGAGVEQVADRIHKRASCTRSIS